MEIQDVKNKIDFKTYLEERARFRSLSNLYQLVEDNNSRRAKTALKNDFDIEQEDLSKAWKWLKEICSKTFIMEDISYLLKNHSELMKIKDNLFFSAGICIHKGIMFNGQFMTTEGVMYDLSSIKQLWKETEVK